MCQIKSYYDIKTKRHLVLQHYTTRTTPFGNVRTVWLFTPTSKRSLHLRAVVCRYCVHHVSVGRAHENDLRTSHLSPLLITLMTSKVLAIGVAQYSRAICYVSVSDERSWCGIMQLWKRAISFHVTVERAYITGKETAALALPETRSSHFCFKEPQGVSADDQQRGAHAHLIWRI